MKNGNCKPETDVTPVSGLLSSASSFRFYNFQLSVFTFQLYNYARKQSYEYSC